MSGFKDQVIDPAVKAKATRLAFGEELAELGAKHPQVVALDADLSKSTRTDIFAEKFPNRFFNLGIAEANMIGVAAGLAGSGHIPFAASFGCFLTGRYDQIRMSVSFTGANVRLVGTHAGVAIGEDGHSQMALEDLALMRSLPNMTVFQPGDEQDTREFMRWSISHDGPCYMRLTRQNMPALRRAGRPFAPGVWGRLGAMPWEGSASSAKASVLLLATGGLIEPSIGAAEKLAVEGYRVGLVNANWIKPFDEALLLESIRARVDAVVTLEDHSPVAGLGGTVAEFLAEQTGAKPRLVRIGVDGFGQSGSPQANYEAYGFTPEKLSARIKLALTDVKG